MAQIDMNRLKDDIDSKVGQNSEKKKMEPIAMKGNVNVGKKTWMTKFASNFIAKDVDDIREYIIFDCIIPGIKSGLLDVASLLLSGEPMSKRIKRSEKKHTDFSSYYKGSTYESSSRSRRERYKEDDNVDYRRIVLEYRDDAEALIDRLHKMIKEDGSCSVADLLEAVNAPSRFVDNNWGWTDRRDIGLRRVSDGWLIDVCEAERLED